MNDLPTLNRCVNLLMAQLADKQEEFRRAKKISSMNNRIPKLNKIARQIDSIETRLRRAEKLQEAALARPDRRMR